MKRMAGSLVNVSTWSAVTMAMICIARHLQYLTIVPNVSVVLFLPVSDNNHIRIKQDLIRTSLELR
jgi:hypothetical protein